MTQDVKITPVILCGGSGTRLWPLSRQSYPKQFSALLGEASLFQDAVRRLAGPGYAAPLVVTQDAFRFIAAAQMDAVGAGALPGRIVIEPDPRNTAPAALAAALICAKTDPGGLMLLCPADHLIPDDAAFRAAVQTGAAAAEAGKIVAFGVPPTRAETGFGYLEVGPRADGPVQPLARFVEKPNAATAATMATSGRHLWNAGVFLCRPDSLIEAFGAHAPDYLPPVRASVSAAAADLGFLRLGEGPWGDVPPQSLDYAVMERAGNLAVVPLDTDWSDLGDWSSVWGVMEKDARGVATAGAATAIDCDGSLLRSDGDGVEIVGIGLKDTIAVAMDDAVLVADVSRAQDVREAVAQLRAKKASQADQLPRDYRPWGWYEVLVRGDRFGVKRIVVTPGAKLSLQSHVHRAEHWIVVEGTAKVTIADDETLVTENQSVYVPLGAKHRLENPGKVPLVLIEVQTGGYLGEDDITRYEDVYARK